MGDRNHPRTVVARADHGLAEWEARDRNELDICPRQWQTNDSDGLRSCGDDVPNGQPQTRNNEPDDIADDAQSPTAIGVHDFPAEWPENESGDAERGYAEGDGHDEQACHNAGQNVAQEKPDACGNKPDDVENQSN